MEIFGIPLQAWMSQLLLGLVNGSFYAMLSLGLAVIFGLLNVINFAHGALYMVGAFLAYLGVTSFGLSYWAMLVLAPQSARVWQSARGQRLPVRLVRCLDGLVRVLLRPAGRRAAVRVRPRSGRAG